MCLLLRLDNLLSLARSMTVHRKVDRTQLSTELTSRTTPAARCAGYGEVCQLQGARRSNRNDNASIDRGQLEIS